MSLSAIIGMAFIITTVVGGFIFFLIIAMKKESDKE